MPDHDPAASPARYSTNRPHRAARRGFTLIEILVVIAIVAVLAAMLFPTLAKARASAQRVSCLSNMRQIGMAIQMYTMGHAERMPGPGPSGREWPLSLQPYIGSTQIFSCITDPHEGEPSIAGMGTAKLSYGWNSLDVGDGRYGFRKPDGTPLALSRVDQPSETIVIFDYLATNAPSEGHLTNVGHLDTGSATTTRVEGRHLDGFNTLYADSHVKWRKFGATKVGDWTVQSD